MCGVMYGYIGCGVCNVWCDVWLYRVWVCVMCGVMYGYIGRRVCNVWCDVWLYRAKGV